MNKKDQGKKTPCVIITNVNPEMIERIYSQKIEEESLGMSITFAIAFGKESTAKAVATELREKGFEAFPALDMHAKIKEDKE